MEPTKGTHSLSYKKLFPEIRCGFSEFYNLSYSYQECKLSHFSVFHLRSDFWHWYFIVYTIYVTLPTIWYRAFFWNLASRSSKVWLQIKNQLYIVGFYTKFECAKLGCLFLNSSINVKPYKPKPFEHFMY